jgi:hypothetical protein
MTDEDANTPGLRRGHNEIKEMKDGIDERLA